ncbi:MAG TPA: dihydropteroate synthase [Thermoguttaceae bacterium]|nr:dihydropteroate synthase [Thermoguttaceae bacterium]
MSVSRATCWRLRTRTIAFERLPRLMGVVNVTPDSFSDGGRYFDPSAAVDHALRLVDEGADLLDIGGESTRPGAAPVDADEELRRVMPVVERLVATTDIPLSIDTSKAAVARGAIAAGVEAINDVTGLTGDPEMLPLAVESGAGVCVMHMQGTPRSMQAVPTYADVVAEVRDYLAGRRDVLLVAGVERERICLDPGIGFGKTTEHNLELLRQIEVFQTLGCPVLVGPSRKAFIGQVLGDVQADRAAGTLGVVLAMARRGVQIVRVHDVAEARRALALFEAAGGLD